MSLKLLGLFRVVPDLDAVADEDWKTGKALSADTDYAKPVLNCYDESALELMLRCSDRMKERAASPGNEERKKIPDAPEKETESGIQGRTPAGESRFSELTALTVGRRRDESFLKTLYALGFDHCVRIEPERKILFEPEIIAEAAAGYVRANPQDVVLAGQQSSDGNNRKTAFLLAEKLEWPCISEVLSLEPAEEDPACLKVVIQAEGGKWVLNVRPPCILTVGNVAGGYLRVPTLKDRMSRGRKLVEVFELGETARNAEPGAVLVQLEKAGHERETVWIEGGSPEEKAASLYENYLKEWLRDNEISSGD